MKNNSLAITIGDYNGVGPKCVELALRKLNLKKTKIFVIGDNEIFDKLNFPKSKNIELINIGNKIHFDPGKPTKFSGSVMAFWSEKIKVSLSTIHVPIKNVVKDLNSEKLLSQLESIDSNFTKILKRRPSIALCAINPHVSENGAIGDEDLKITVPAANKARKKGINVNGPFSADTLFSKKNIRNFDIFHAIYHDQGLIPFKMISFDKGVNFTLNLPFIRTSPDHGTAYDIAWNKNPNSLSMVEAIKLAIKL